MAPTRRSPPRPRAAAPAAADAPATTEAPAATAEAPATLTEIRVAARRERVARMLGRRLTIAEIATALHVSERTVQGDARALRDEMARELASRSVLDVAGDVVRAAHVRERELWLLFEQAKGGEKRDARGRPVKANGKPVVEAPDRKLQLKVLAELRATERDKLAALQSLGVVYQAPQRIDVTQRMLALLGDLPPDTLGKLASAGSDADLYAMLVEAVGPDAAARLLEGEDGALAGALTGVAGALAPGDEVFPVGEGRGEGAGGPPG